MLRIVFTAEDAGRVRIAGRPDPLWETVLSLHQLSADGWETGPYRHWGRWLRTAGGERAIHAARVLYRLAPPQGYFPDFLTPAEGLNGLDAGLEAIMRTPRRRLRAEIAKAGAAGPLPAWTAELGAGKPARLDWLATVIRTYHREALGPFRHRIGAEVDAHRAALSAVLTSRGVDAMLATLGPAIQWSPPVLTARYPADMTIELAGRGLTLVPSFFCHRTPVALADAELEPVLVYPIDPPPGWMLPGGSAGGGLSALTGVNRAALLAALVTPCGTSELAARVGLPLSSTSEQTTILRDAGLVTSERHGRRVRHSLTPLGRSVLAGEVMP